MATYLPQLAALYVVSDVHMGGEKRGDRDFQIFDRGPRLAALIHHVQAQRPNEDVAFVLNGDVVDSLAEEAVPGFVALDPRIALRMMERIYEDPAFSPVWMALSEFVRRPGRHLVFVVGNHDIELSLPIVEDSIRRRLAEGDVAAQARIAFATHGEGFACRVGATRVFCTHGNENDPMNWVDYSLLGQLANAMNAGRVVAATRWKPNAGTRLVVNVMNEIKEGLPFVDLLKPEVAAVVSVLIALDLDAVRKIDLLEDLPIIRDAIRGALVTRGLLGAAEASLAAVPPEAVAEEMADRLLGPNLRAAVSAARPAGRTEDELLLEAGEAIASGTRASDVLEAGGAPETLGAWDLFRGWLGLVDRLEGLRLALKDWIKDDTTYDPSKPDWLSNAMADRAGDGVGFVITGHSHLARALTRGPGSHYFNCGTWIRLLRLTDEVLADRPAFEQRLWPALMAGKMSALDAASIPGPGGQAVPLLFDRTNVVRISASGGRVTGELLRVTDGANGEAVLAQEPGTAPFTIG